MGSPAPPVPPGVATARSRRACLGRQPDRANARATGVWSFRACRQGVSGVASVVGAWTADGELSPVRGRGSGGVPAGRSGKRIRPARERMLRIRDAAVRSWVALFAEPILVSDVTQIGVPTLVVQGAETTPQNDGCVRSSPIGFPKGERWSSRERATWCRRPTQPRSPRRWRPTCACSMRAPRVQRGIDVVAPTIDHRFRGPCRVANGGRGPASRFLGSPATVHLCLHLRHLVGGCPRSSVGPRP